MRPLGATLAAVSVWASSVPADQIVPLALEALPPADIVILGEIHDNPHHHDNQAIALRALAPTAVVFEMLDADQAATVNALGGSHPELADRIGWAGSGWPDWSLYAPVFDAVGGAQVFGAAVPRTALRSALEDGPGALLGETAAAFALETPLPEDEQTAREMAQQEAHCNALPEDVLPRMVMAQRLRDAAFAHTTLKALEETGGPVAVITGTGHARTDWGMPAALRRAAPDRLVLSVGQLEHAPDDRPAPFDLWLVSPPAEREDPCVAFREAQGGG